MNTWVKLANVKGTKVLVAESVNRAITEASTLSDYTNFEPTEAVVLVTGSLYLVGGFFEVLGEPID